ncbi:hypothetical protein PTKIN_Ptkin07bG0247400 [Pterospermum kingtungense]
MLQATAGRVEARIGFAGSQNLGEEACREVGGGVEAATRRRFGSSSGTRGATRLCKEEARSPVSSTLPQVGSRLYLAWGILWSFPKTHILVTSLVISWFVTEIIRYSFFGVKETFGFAPSWHLWHRYNTFLVLYPTGISSEVRLIYFALPYIKASEKYCIRLPNKWNFSFDYFCTAFFSLGIYIYIYISQV